MGNREQDRQEKRLYKYWGKGKGIKIQMQEALSGFGTKDTVAKDGAPE